MNIANEFEVTLSFEQLEDLVTLMKNEGAKGTDAVYLTNLGRVGNFATLGIRDEYGFADAMYFRVRGNKSHPYKCHDCRNCAHHDTVDGWVYCHRDYDDDAPRVGYDSDELLESCRDFVEEVTHE